MQVGCIEDIIVAGDLQELRVGSFRVRYKSINCSIVYAVDFNGS
jgi:hypothetical protein